MAHKKTPLQKKASRYMYLERWERAAGESMAAPFVEPEVNDVFMRVSLTAERPGTQKEMRADPTLNVIRVVLIGMVKQHYHKRVKAEFESLGHDFPLQDIEVPAVAQIYAS